MVLIDEPRWWHRGRRWSHMISDTEFEELHAFAQQAGLPARGFHRDHYDIPEEMFADMVALGARVTPSREIVAALRAAGLRRPSQPSVVG